MNVAETAILAFSMSADAFAAALGKGAALRRPPILEALRTGMIFGAVETITPIIGWAIGLTAAAWIESIDHWVAFVLLSLVGAKMIAEALRRPVSEEARPERHGLGPLVVTAIGTSLDALAVGVTLSFIGANIVTTAAAIGFATFVMATLGMIIGRMAGSILGRAAEFAGGGALILIGLGILMEHTGALG